MSYKNPVPTVDTIIERAGKILLVRRGIWPEKGKLATPGGHVEYGERVADAARRETKEETGLDVELTDILGVFSSEGTDPRGERFSVVFIGRPAPGRTKRAKAGSDATKTVWADPKKLRKEQFGFKHFEFIKAYLKWKKKKGTYWTGKE